MIRIRVTGWRRDLLVGVLASLLTAAALVPLGWAAVRGQRRQAEDARNLALQVARLADQQAAAADDRLRRNLVDQAANLLDFHVAGDNPDAEIFHVTTDAVAPEVPAGAHLLIDKKAAAFGVGDIVVFRVADKNYLGRVRAVDREAGLLTVGRNGEPDRRVPGGDVLGRGVLNTR
jgi:hypothetical protein